MRERGTIGGVRAPVRWRCAGAALLLTALLAGGGCSGGPGAGPTTAEAEAAEPVPAVHGGAGPGQGPVRRSVDVERLTRGRSRTVPLDGGSASQLRALGYVVGESSFQATPPVWRTEEYDAPSSEGFHAPENEPLSTFSIDVDTASYANVRRFLHEDRLPPPGAVRTEELINYFQYQHAEPEPGVPFGVTTEWASSPWHPDHQLLMIGLRSAPIRDAALPPRNLVFLLDVSGSMQSPDKLPLVKRAMATLSARLRAQDRVAVVVYAGASGVVLPPTPGDRKAQILGALEGLRAGGSTNGGEGLALAYSLARDSFREGGVNRVILATDGDFNMGTTSRSELVGMIEAQRASGVALTVLGVGTGNLKDATMEELADRGDGNYAYLDSLHEARKVLVEEAGGTLVTVARDVKLQVEFNPQHVAGYRLVGYDNRRLAARDFDDDAKDAGEIGAGHSVTAFYEIVPRGAASAPEPSKLRYQGRGEVEAGLAGELCVVKLRYKEPDEEASRLLRTVVEGTPAPFEDASEDLRYGASVALFGTLLRHPTRLRDTAGDPWERVRTLARSALGDDSSGRRAEFLALASRARVLQDALQEGGADLAGGYRGER